MFQRGLEVMAVHHQFGAKGLHRRVLLDRVALGHDDGRGEPVGARGEGDRLAVIAARRGDDAGTIRTGSPQFADMDQPAAHLEGAGRRMVLVLDPDIGAGACGEQRPGVGRRRRHRRVDDGGGGLDAGAVGQVERHGGGPVCWNRRPGIASRMRVGY